MDTQATTARPKVFSLYANKVATLDVFERYGLSAKYMLGQNFLINDAIVRKIVNLADLQASDRILEVGPGIGTLSAALLPQVASLTAIEKDAELIPVLSETLEPWSEKLTLIQKDACESVRGDKNDEPTGLTGALATCNKMVSNLPYAVAATLILAYFQSLKNLESATVMVQKEVADRILAHPKTKTYGAYTVKLQLYAQVKDRFQVSPANFFPAPHVESSVVRLDRRVLCGASHTPLSEAQLQATTTIIDAAFATRRKTLANSCKVYFVDQPEISSKLPWVFNQAAIDSKRRGETLSLEEFLNLGSAFLALRSNFTSDSSR